MPPKKTKEKGKKEQEKVVEPWRDSEAKHILRAMIVDGTVTGKMKVEDVFQMHALFQDYEFPNFKRIFLTFL